MAVVSTSASSFSAITLTSSSSASSHPGSTSKTLSVWSFSGFQIGFRQWSHGWGLSFLASFLTNYQLKTWRHHCTGHYLGHWWQLALTNSSSHYWDGCETVFVMFITLLPLSGQALLQGSESPTSATYSNSSEIEGWNMPSFLSRKDMKNVLLWLPIGTPFNCSADRKNLTWNH